MTRTSSHPLGWLLAGPRPAVVIVGCGLIGGSLGLALRAAAPALAVVGVDRPGVVARARAAGACTGGAPVRRDDLAACVARALAAHDPGLVLLALPVGLERPLLGVLQRWQRGRATPALVLDVGSVKASVVTAAAQLPGFVGGHPMAGRERGGLAFATSDLFVDRTFALCRAAMTRRVDLQRARSVVHTIGARPLVLDAAEHDRWVAWTSHLPHVLAVALMGAVLQRTPGRRVPPRGRHGAATAPWGLAAGAFRDVTRVARADPDLWQRILAANAGPVADAAEELATALRRFAAQTRRRTPRPLDALGDPDRIAAARAALEPHLPAPVPPTAPALAAPRARRHSRP